jgi:hypothetical protein
MNSRKGALGSVLDPFEIEDGWFQLELDGYQVIPGPGVDRDLAEKIQHTIDVLKLNGNDCLRARGEYVEQYLHEDLSFRYLEKRAPFVARELRWQRRLLEKDR